MTTLAEIRDQVKDDLELHEETFVDDTDLNRWINQAIRNVERKIHTLYEDYFMTTSEDNVLASGVNMFDYPSNIYANKIKKIIFKDNLGLESSTHEVERRRDINNLVSQDLYHADTVNPILTWTPVNSEANGKKIRLFPKSGRAGYLDIWYIRNAKRLVNDTDVCDIDEFEDVVTDYTKWMTYKKDGDPRQVGAKEDYLNGILDLENTLSNMVPDHNNEIPADYSHYSDSVGGEC